MGSLFKSKSKSSSTQTQTVDQTQTPQVPEWLAGPYRDYTGPGGVQDLIGVNANPSLYTVPGNANTNGAFQRAQSLGSNPYAFQGGEALQGLLGFTPQTISNAGNDYGAALVQAPTDWRTATSALEGNYSPRERAQLSGDYMAGQLAGTDLSPYQNPYNQQVIDATMADWNQGVASGLNQLKAATPTGAFGGSRQGVAMGQFLGDQSRALGSTLAGLRQAGFQNAQQAAQSDIAARNQFQAQRNADLQQLGLFNAGAANQFGMAENSDRLQNNQFNASSQNQMLQARNAAELQAALANAAAQNQFKMARNADNLSTQQFNSNAGLAGANFRQGAATSLAGLGMNMNADERANIGLLGQTGADQRAIDLANNPLLARTNYMNALGGLLGMTNGQMFTGQRTQGTTTGMGMGTGTSTPSTASSIGQVAGIAGSIMGLFSDARLKTDAHVIGTDENGVRWWKYRYVWDAPGTERVGVMAQEAPAHAVHMHPSGYLMVDYGAL